MIAVPQREQRSCIMAEQKGSTSAGLEYIKINQEPEAGITETMLPRHKAPVHDASDQESGVLHAASRKVSHNGSFEVMKMRPDSSGICHGRFTPPNASATASPA